MSRYRLTFTVDLVREHEVPDEFAAGDKALELHAAFTDAMAAVPQSGVLLGAVDVASLPPEPGTQFGTELPTHATTKRN